MDNTKDPKYHDKFIETCYAKTKAYITPGYGVPEVDEKDERAQGICLHHSYVPDRPVKDRDYATIFNDYHFGELAGWHKVNGIWVNEYGTLFGLRYDFVISWWNEPDGGGQVAKFWTSMRWIKQMQGGHAVNRKGQKWPGPTGKIIRPNSELVSACVVGNYDKIAIPSVAVNCLYVIARSTACDRHLFFHSDFDHKTCPGLLADKASIHREIFR